MESDKDLIKDARKGLIYNLRTFPAGYLTELLNKLTWEFEQKCGDYYNREEVNIYLPKILNHVLEEEFRRVVKGIHYPQYFKGYKILPGYEYCKIIIAHERYPDTNDDRYFHSIDIIEKVDING